MKATWTTISGRTQCAYSRGRPTARVKGGFGISVGVQAGAQLAEQRGVEPGADLAREDEVVAIVVADEQRPEADAGALADR